MKKLTTGLLAGVMILSLGSVSVSAATTFADGEFTPMNIKEKASEAGLTVKEYLEQMDLEFDGERPEGRPEFDGEKPDGMFNSEEKQAEIEEKAAELGLSLEEYKEQMKAEREAKREEMIAEKAAEAGLSVEEYSEQMKENKPSGAMNKNREQ